MGSESPDQVTCNILLVEDNPGDIRLTEEVMRDSKVPIQLHVVRDGVEAMQFLHREAEYRDRPRPDLILLDLNLPRKDGREVLAEAKGDPNLRTIPILMLTTSKAERDVQACYDLHANCYLNKPLDLDQFMELMEVVERFWLQSVLLPPHVDSKGATSAPRSFAQAGR